MWRVLVFLGLLCLAAYGAVWLAGNPETIAVTWAGQEYSISLAVGVVGLVAIAILLSLLFGGLRALAAMPVRLRHRAQRRRREKGYGAITRGIVAVGSGDVAAARRYAGEAGRLVGHEPLALLLKAQAAQASGQREAAEAAFREMTARPDTKVLGLRGLYLEARRRGDGESAREHAEEAALLAPALGWASDAVLEGLSAEGDWAGAVRTIERRTSLGLIDKTTSRRQRAVLLTGDAMAREEQDSAGALAAAEQAVKLAPDLVPAAALAGRLLSERGDLKRAARIIETAWATSPHPDLAGAYLNLRPGDSAMDRLRRAETLAKLSSWSDEARFAIARAAIEARELPRAREVLRPVLEQAERPTVRLCMAMAEIEGRGGQAGAAREWLARAARARRDKAWMADGVVSERWAPVSPATGRLDAFVWDTPPDMLGSSGEMDAASFEPDSPDAAEEMPAFLGRSLAPPAPQEASPASREALPAEPALVPAPVLRATPDTPSTRRPVPSSDPEVPAEPPKPTVADRPAATPPPAEIAISAGPTPDSGPIAAVDRAGQEVGTARAPAATAEPERPVAVPARQEVARPTGSPIEPGAPVGRRLGNAEIGKTPAPGVAPERTVATPSRDEGAAATEAPIDAGSVVGRRLGNAEIGKTPPPGRPAETAGVPAKPAEMPAEPAGSSRPVGANGGSAPLRGRSVSEPEPVVFPVRHAPDDPGPDGDGDRRQRFRLRV